MRLTKLYTRTGDQGNTRLGDGTRLPKDDLRVVAYGDIDELNSCLGLVRAQKPGTLVEPLLATIQNELFHLGGELSMPGQGTELVADTSVQRMEGDIDDLNGQLPPLKEFILPTGSIPGATLHLARTICRRAERSLVTLHQREPQRATLLHYLNRLSDLLFVLARWVNRESAEGEVFWEKP